MEITRDQREGGVSILSVKVVEKDYAPEVEKLFRDLEAECEQMRYLGTYNEVIC